MKFIDDRTETKYVNDLKLKFELQNNYNVGEAQSDVVEKIFPIHHEESARKNRRLMVQLH